jgi:hypothetical protein
MIDLLRKLCATSHDLLFIDAGQDLVEYAFLIMILALGTIASIPPLASALAPMIDAVSAAL